MGFGGMFGGGGGGMGMGGNPLASMIANKLTGTLENMAGKAMDPDSFARMQAGIVSGGGQPAPAPAPAPKSEEGGGGGGGGLQGIFGMLGKGKGNLDQTGGSNFFEQAKNFIGGMFQ